MDTTAERIAMLGMIALKELAQTFEVGGADPPVVGWQTEEECERYVIQTAEQIRRKGLQLTCSID